MRLSVIRNLAIIAGMLPNAGAAPAATARWQLVGTTYNSVAFVDLGSITKSGELKTAKVVRVSGQPGKDGWLRVDQLLGADCPRVRFIDNGSVILKPDGSHTSFPGSGAYQSKPARGLFADLFETLCHGRSGKIVSDPVSWTHQNFRPH
jgi:hypothetical protein